MGLDFSHGDAHWSYGGFARARHKLAACIGVDLADMESYGGCIPWNRLSDPIVFLLHHSDCDGELTPDECRLVAPRLRELVENWPDRDYDRQHFLDLASGMEEAATKDEPLEFT